MEISGQLRELWRLAGGDPLDDASNWNSTFDPIGLVLFAPPKNGGYWCTPENSIAFATTGGDGVHFSWITTPDVEPEFAPIVMTVPMTDTPNLIVGANLREFLCLGSRFGYFSLEQLVYKPEETLDALAKDTFDAEATSEQRSLLQRLAESFDLRPWADPRSRLDALQSQYASLLRLPSPDDVV